MRRHWKAGKTDNTDAGLKLDLRQAYMEKVGATLCFDLFAGCGTYTEALYRHRFGRVVCVEKQSAKCAEIVQTDNVTVYCADNRRVTGKLLAKWGQPDFIDLDAYGSPDAILRTLLMFGKLQRTAIVATDGLFTGRQQSAVMPEAWGYGKGLKMTPQSVGSDEWPYLIETHLREWAGEFGLRSTEFIAMRAPRAVVWYWAAVVEKLA